MDQVLSTRAVAESLPARLAQAGLRRPAPPRTQVLATELIVRGSGEITPHARKA